MVGETISHYRILSKLGEGGMGVVYRAEDLSLGRLVALKFLSPHLSTDADAKLRFTHEAKAAAALNHPGICTVHDVGEAEGQPYLAMEYVEGESLKERIARGPLPISEALEIAAQVADALHEAHGKGVTHRDIKPANIMLTPNGRAKVMDFGLAQIAGATHLTRSGSTLGTAAYMSPEQAHGEATDHRTDIWSLGVLLYELVSGLMPFRGEHEAALLYGIQHNEVEPLTGLRTGVPGELERVVAKCLAKDAGHRYQHADELAVDLRRLPTQLDSTRTAPRPSQRVSEPRLWFVAAAVIVIVAAGSQLLLRSGRKAPAPAKVIHERTEIAVLPFQNLSAGGPNAYFASGLHDELLTQLAKVAALKVISRTSVMAYATTAKPLRQIAGELGVGSIVEGSVQVAGNRLRVNVQLIDAATDEHLWAERYDRSLDDAFAIQSDVAQRIVEEVGATLAPQERQGLTEAPTADPEAYRLFLQGEEYRRRPGNFKVNLVSAQKLYERALALDPNFALAHAGLSIVHGTMLWFGYDPAPTRAAKQLAEAETALRLAPRLSRAHMAMGLVHYRTQLDYRRALEEFQIALRAAPNDAELLAFVGYAERRLGHWAAVDSAYQRLILLDPRNADYAGDLGGVTYMFVRRYADAVRALDRAVALAPDLALYAVAKGYVYVLWKGDLDTLRLLATVPADMDLGSGLSSVMVRAELLLWERKADSLLALSRGLQCGPRDVDEFFQPDLLAAWAHELRGDKQAARAAFASALGVLAMEPDAGPLGFVVHAQRGAALAGLGRKVEALEEVRWLRESRICREDHYEAGPTAARARAIILAQLGESDAALDEIQRLLAGPTPLTVHTLRLDPRWDPIREHPRFKALLVKYANPELPTPVETK